ncbi:MAG: glycosyltransferase [Comamonadaceae bacterium]|nr:MAG: glycosyltransferase [Comamonadaceae bacterium]
MSRAAPAAAVAHGLPPEAARRVATTRVSILIKALNEERHIAATLESVLAATAHLDAEVVLADSASTDRTLEIAAAYPVRVVTLARPDERCCGIGAQLGFQHCDGDFVYILDGDMVLRAGFLEQALAFLGEHPDIAGVGGQIAEQNTESLEYIARNARHEAHKQPGEVDRLDGGALYRRDAVEAAGYLTDRNLHSYEEFDLAVRLRALGWRLWRLPLVATSHYGHDAPPYRLLVRRWRSRYIDGLGELVRAAAGRGQLRAVMRGVRELRLYLAVWAWWATLLAAALGPWSGPVRGLGVVGLLAAPFVAMALRKRSTAKAAYSVVSWCFCAAGLLRGLLRGRRPARERIDSRVLREPDGAAVALAPGHSTARPASSSPTESPLPVPR